ncbi:zinc finger protein 431-like [Wyeomyia smithii]|uniref:zinc finger protein 431-like n=1 Tax=Wyeomyia smithii TaxID=174621 RepID=UPI002467EB6C|nr:zinc finger protein 431-like [Wyeomyia smithii]
MSLINYDACPFEKQDIRCKICECTEGAMESIFCESNNERLLDKIARCTGVELKPAYGMISPVCEFCRCRIDQFDDTFKPQQKEYVVEKVRTCSEAPDDDPFNCLEIDVRPDISEYVDLPFEIKDEDSCELGNVREVGVEEVLKKARENSNFLNHSPQPEAKHDDTGRQLNGKDYSSGDEYDDKLDDHSASDVENLIVELSESVEKEISTTPDSELVPPKRPTECKICGKRVTYMRDHMRLHSDQKKFKCPHCDRSFTQSNNLIYHVRKHTGEKPFPCDKCEKSFICKSHLLSHQRSHVNDQPFVCEFCSKRFNQACNLTKHLRVHSGEKPYKCKFCNKAFMNLSNMKTHEMRHRGERNFTCDVCSKSFYDSHHLERHIATHSTEKQFKCALCPKAYRTANALKTHANNCVRLQISLKCDICQETFPTQKQLTRHHKIHADAELQGSLQCPVCSRAFKKPKVLEKHIQRVHSETATQQIDPVTDSPQLEADPRKFHRCEVCSKEYITAETLQVHLRLHMPTEKQYKCERCPRSYSKKDNLANHIRTHTGEKPFACEYCASLFDRRSDLRNHQIMHHKHASGGASKKARKLSTNPVAPRNTPQLIELPPEVLPDSDDVVIKFEIKNV